LFFIISPYPKAGSSEVKGLKDALADQLLPGLSGHPLDHGASSDIAHIRIAELREEQGKGDLAETKHYGSGQDLIDGLGPAPLRRQGFGVMRLMGDLQMQFQLFELFFPSLLIPDILPVHFHLPPPIGWGFLLQSKNCI
jgi:hypothetical protein